MFGPFISNSDSNSELSDELSEIYAALLNLHTWLENGEKRRRILSAYFHLHLKLFCSSRVS